MRVKGKPVTLIIAASSLATALAIAPMLMPGEIYSHPVQSGKMSPQQQSASDRQILVDLYYDMNGQNWLVPAPRYNRDPYPPSNWLNNEPIDVWHGVTSVGSRVTRLDLGGLGISGTISPKVGNLTNLTFLDFGGTHYHYVFAQNKGTSGYAKNNLSGNIPTELGNLTNLTHLNLTDNNLSGSIPPELGNLTNLTHLNLTDNNLSGSIPPELGNLTNLEYLDLTDNNLSGSIPPELTNLTDLTYLRLQNQGLSGCIPHGLRYLPNSDIPQIAQALPFCAAPTPTPTATDVGTGTVGTATITPTPEPTTPLGEPVVNFHASQTEVPKGEPVVLTLSVANSIVNPEMTLQLVLQIPSGVSVRGEGLSEACSVQCSVIYKVPTGENRDFPLTAVPNQVGSFSIAGRIEWYFGDDPTTHAGKLSSLTLNAADPVAAPTPTPSIVGETTVNLHATQTEVRIGEPVVLTLAADNSIAKPDMTLKFILRVPSGWSISGAGFTEACSGQCTATYQVPSGEQKSIFLEMLPNQIGSFNAEALIEWYFGDDVSTLTRESESLALKVVAPEPLTVTSMQPTARLATPTLTSIPARQGDTRASCGLASGESGSGGIGDTVLLGLTLLGLVGLRRRHRSP